MRIDPLGLFDLGGRTLEQSMLWYFFGGGRSVSVGFDEVDIGLKPRDFPGYAREVQSMYKKVGTRTANLTAKRDIGGWAGQLDYALEGYITSDACKWTFEGTVQA